MECALKTIQQLQQIEAKLGLDAIPTAKQLWGGADVIIGTAAPALPKDPNSFYPDKRYVVTAFAAELSWLFERLFEAFYADQLIDGCSKIEFCGRLANAANRCIARNEADSAHRLLAAVLHEAFCIYEEMQDGGFEYLTIAFGNDIADDYVDDAHRHGFLGVEETERFFSERGANLE